MLARWNSLFAIPAVVVLAAGCSESERPSIAQEVQQTEWSLEDLSADQGVSFRIPEREVPAEHEEQSCYFLRAPDVIDGKDYWVDHTRLAMNSGSHHLNIFRVRTVKGLDPNVGEPTMVGPYPALVQHGKDEYLTHPCWQSAEWSDWPLVANTQNGAVGNPYTDWQLPDGVAMRFTPGEMLMIQTHYVNTSTQPTPSGKSKIAINLYRSKLENPIELGTLFATQQSLRVCKSNPEPTFSGACKFPGAVTVTAANGHFHSRGDEFGIFSWDGQSISHPPEAQRFYQSHEWDHPDMRTNIGANVPAGGGVWWDCKFKWSEPIFGCDTVNEKDPEKANDCCYTFGGNTDVGEHCNVFLYYYPKVADSDVFCN